MGVRGFLARLFGRRRRRRRPGREAQGQKPPDREPPRRQGLAGETPHLDFSDYEGVLQTMRSGFGASDDVVVHEIRLGLDRGLRAALVFVDGMVDRRVLGDDVVAPLLRPADQLGLKAGKSVLQVITEQVLSASQTDATAEYPRVVDRVLSGDLAIIVEGQKQALMVDVKGFVARMPGHPFSELNIKGSFEGFTEVLKTNITQVRRRVRSEKLRVKTFTLGRTSHNQVALLYVEGVANPALVEEVGRRVRSIDHDAVTLSAVIQSIVADNPLTMFPLFRDTERPDFAALELLNGKVVLMVDNTPSAAALPSTLFDFLRSSEDYAAVFWVGSFLRPMRYIAVLLGAFLPALYVAVLSAHPLFIPHRLALSVIVSRNGIPFPPGIEVALLLLVVEILREATARLPSAMGPTLTTVGGIVLGTAAVNARIVSDLSLIVAAVTGISQLIAPGFELSYVNRILAWPILLAGATFGLFGVVMAAVVLAAHVARLESVGVSYLGPLLTGEGLFLRDVLIRAPFASLRHRPMYLWPLDLVKQGRIAPRSVAGRRLARQPFPVGIEPMEELLEDEVRRGGDWGPGGSGGDDNPGGR